MSQAVCFVGLVRSWQGGAPFSAGLGVEPPAPEVEDRRVPSDDGGVAVVAKDERRERFTFRQRSRQPPSEMGSLLLGSLGRARQGLAGRAVGAGGAVERVDVRTDFHSDAADRDAPAPVQQLAEPLRRPARPVPPPPESRWRAESPGPPGLRRARRCPAPAALSER